MPDSTRGLCRWHNWLACAYPVTDLADALRADTDVELQGSVTVVPNRSSVGRDIRGHVRHTTWRFVEVDLVGVTLTSSPP